jgi:hypothetical protein
LIASSFFLNFLELVGSGFVIFSKLVGVIRLLLNITLAGKNFGFTASNLFAESSDLTLDFVVGSVLLVEEETSVVSFLLEALKADKVAVVAGLEVVILEKFLVLEVAVLGLDGVELVAESEVVLVALLNLEDFSLKLGDKKVLLVGGKVHRVIVLRERGR